MAKKPKVSIGLAVYNGEEYLEEAIQSILAQTYTDFELIISDNASTDRTFEISQKYANIDNRIRYFKNKSNIGGANNENLTFKKARGEYFRWAAHDDICEPNLLEELVKVLDHQPSVVLAYSKIIQIDDNGNTIGFLEYGKANSNNPYERFKDLSAWGHDCEVTYGLMRSDVMRLTDLQRNYTDSDRTFLCELSFYGRLHQVPKYLFKKRYHQNMSTQVYKNWRERMKWFGVDHDNVITLPFWIQFFHYLEIIYNSPISIQSKVQCYFYMVSWVFSDQKWARMINDFIIAGRKVISRFTRLNRRIQVDNYQN
jgi:glycosyltransferase involved in cell wall biosynthesis